MNLAFITPKKHINFGMKMMKVERCKRYSNAASGKPSIHVTKAPE